MEFMLLKLKKPFTVNEWLLYFGSNEILFFDNFRYQFPVIAADSYQVDTIFCVR